MKKKEIIIAVSVVAVLIVGAIIAINSKPTGATVATEVVKKGALKKTASITGEVVSNNTYSTVLNPALKISSVDYKEGEDVKKGSVILSYDSSDVKSELESARTNLKGQKQILSDLKSTKEPSVPASAGMSQGQVAQANSANNAAKKSSIKSQELVVDAAENTVKSLEKKLDSFKVTSPINGKITKLKASKDSIPGQGDMLEIHDTTNIKVKLSLSQYDSALVKKGQAVSISISGINEKFSGEVISVASVAENSNANPASTDKSITAEVSIDEKSEDVKIGFEAECTITLQEKDSTYISYDSIKKDKSGAYVFIIEDNTAKKKYVKTGIETDSDIEITEGLKEGEKYIKSPSDTLKDGAPVNESKLKEKKNE